MIMTYLQQRFDYIDEDIDATNLDEQIVLKEPYTITSYGADFDVEGLVRRLRNDDIFIPAFQRRYVWGFETASRLIESLLLGLPLPSVFLAVDRDNRYLVIDGQQRLQTLSYFYGGSFPTLFDDNGAPIDWRTFALEGVQAEFRGLTYAMLPAHDRRRLDHTLIHATIVQQDKPEDDNSSIYFIFERLNTGAVALEPHEIRASIYHGPFQVLLTELNHHSAWRALFGNLHHRLRDQELILRFLALYVERANYTEPLKQFMNDFMAAHRNLSVRQADHFSHLFTTTMETIYTCIGDKAFRPKRNLNAAVMDSVSIGVAAALEQGFELSCDDWQVRYRQLIENEDYLDAVSSNTATIKRVNTRLTLALAAFANH